MQPSRDVLTVTVTCYLDQQFLTSVPQEFLKHVIPELYLVRGTDPFSLTLSNKTTTTANPVAIWCE